MLIKDKKLSSRDTLIRSSIAGSIPNIREFKDFEITRKHTVTYADSEEIYKLFHLCSVTG